MTDARVSRVSAEILSTEDGDARVSRVTAQVLSQQDAALRISRVTAQVLLRPGTQNEGTGRVYALDIEVLHKEDLPLPPTILGGGWGIIPIGIGP